MHLSFNNRTALVTGADRNTGAVIAQQLREYELNAIPGEEDPGAWLLARIAFSLRALGYPDQARRRIQESLALTERRARPFGLVLVLISIGWFHADRWEWQQVRERAEEVIQLSTEQGFSYSLAYGMAMRGWALAEQGLVEEGITQMQQGRAAFRTSGAELGWLEHSPRLAAACARVGRIEEGLAMLAEAQTLVDNTGARSVEAELYQLKGELTLQSSVQSLELRAKEAEACFLNAIDIARQQQAKSCELRAATSLARLWQQQGKTAEARKLLSEIYAWFTEGFDTKDLQEAKALLEEMSSP